MPYALVPKSNASHLGLLPFFLVCVEPHTLLIWILFATFHWNLIRCIACIYWIVIAAIRQ